MATTIVSGERRTWTRPQYFAGHVASCYYRFRALFVPERTDNLPFGFCVGPFRTKRELDEYLAVTFGAMGSLVRDW